jgi:hypothetical protein
MVIDGCVWDGDWVSYSLLVTLMGRKVRTVLVGYIHTHIIKYSGDSKAARPRYSLRPTKRCAPSHGTGGVHTVP